MQVLAIIFLVSIATFFGLQAWRWSDNKRTAHVWQDLTRKTRKPRSRFDRTMVSGLPETAQRFFLFTIKPGTVLCDVAEIKTRGEISLGTQEQSNAMAMACQQILAPPYGLIWQLKARRAMRRSPGLMGLAGGTHGPASGDNR